MDDTDIWRIWNGLVAAVEDKIVAEELLAASVTLMTKDTGTGQVKFKTFSIPGEVMPNA